MTPLERATALGLHAVVANWERWGDEPWVLELLQAEEEARNARGLERRIAAAKLGRFNDLADFDWNWPEALDKAQVSELLTLDFITAQRNAIFVGPNGVGKTMLVKNIAYKAALQGHTVLCTTASAMLNELGSKDSVRTLEAAIRKYCRPALLVIDEVGYLSYSNRAADLLFEVISRRYEAKSILLTTNRAFSTWDAVFPNATCVVTLVDRLIHHADVVTIKGKSWRLKESQEAEKAASERRQATPPS
jgi:DNA replication protein DnaC